MTGSEKNVINAAAWEKFISLGLPTRKVEAYRYVRLPQFPEELGEGAFTFNALPEGVMALKQEEARSLFGPLLQSRFESWLEKERDPFACLNAALAPDALVLYAPPNTVAEEIHIVHRGEGGMLYPRLHLFAGKGAVVKLILDQEGMYVNRFFDCTLEEGAHVEVHLAQHAPYQLDALRVNLKRGAQFKCVNAAKSTFQRQDYALSLEGEGSAAHLLGVCELDERDQAHTHVLIEHCAPHTTSSQKFKGVIDGAARASFEGKIYVHPQAQQTDAYQMSNYLILSPKGSANSKPNLEIFADDVKASHGATVGQIDRETLFYLQSRGLAKEEAQRLMIRGFVQEIYDALS